MAEKNINKGVAGRAQNLSNSRAQGVCETIDIEARDRRDRQHRQRRGYDAAHSGRAGSKTQPCFGEPQRPVFSGSTGLTPEQQIAFARNFGDLHIHPAGPQDLNPEIFVIHTHKDQRSITRRLAYGCILR